MEIIHTEKPPITTSKVENEGTWCLSPVMSELTECDAQIKAYKDLKRFLQIMMK